MATVILKNAFFDVDGTDLSDHAHQLQLEYSADEVEDTNFGDDTHLMMANSLKNWTLTVTFAQDYDASSVDDTLFSKVGSSVTVKVRPDAGAIAATNPEFTGSAILTSYPPLGGSIGERLTTEATFQAAGDLSRNTS